MACQYKYATETPNKVYRVVEWVRNDSDSHSLKQLIPHEWNFEGAAPDNTSWRRWERKWGKINFLIETLNQFATKQISGCGKDQVSKKKWPANINMPRKPQIKSISCCWMSEEWQRQSPSWMTFWNENTILNKLNNHLNKIKKNFVLYSVGCSWSDSSNEVITSIFLFFLIRNKPKK